MDDLQAVEEWLGGLLAKMQPGPRREAFKDVARELRRDQAARIAEQRNPDGSPYEPRKARQAKHNLRGKVGRIKRQAMFAKLRTARFLKVESDASSLSIGFVGRAARLASIHQHGESAPVVPGGRNYNYPVRKLLGFTDRNREMIRDKLLAHLTK